MGIIIRQSVKSTIVSYAGILIGTFNTLWLLPKFLLPEEIGLIRLLQDIPLLLAVFLQFGAANIAEKFYFHFKDEKNKDHGFFMLLIIYPLIGFSLFTAVFFIFNDFLKSIYEAKAPLLIDYFFFIIPLAFVMMYLSVLEGYVRVNFRIVVPAFIREIFVRFLFSIILGLYALKIINFDFLILFFVMIYFFSLLFLIGYIKNLKKLFLQIHFRFLNKKLLKEIGIYVLFIIPGTAGSLIASKIDTLMLGAMVGLDYIAIYTLAYFIGTMVEVPRRSLSMIVIPFISQAWKNNDLAKIEELYKKTSLNQFIVGSFLFLLIWCNVDDILNLIPNSHIYKDGKYVIFFIGISRLFDMATGINGEIILYSKYYKFNLISIVFLAIITVIANLIFIPVYGINGAAFAFALTIFFYNVLKSSFIWYKFRIQPFTRNSFIILIFSSVFFVLYIIPYSADHTQIESFLFILAKSLIISVLYLTFIIKFNISEDITMVFYNIIPKMKEFIKKYRK